VKMTTPLEMRKIDNAAINDCGIASVTLMENAGFAVAEITKKVLGGAANKNACVICGKGNNGGDGLVVSRHLINSGFKVGVCLLTTPPNLGCDAKFNFGLLARNSCKICEIKSLGDLEKFIDNFNYSVVVDAVFGTGFSGFCISEPIRSLILFLNAATCKLISVDIPSGLNGSSGKVNDVAIQSDITVTLGLPKRGLFLNDGPSCTGKLIVKNIGLPKLLLQ